MKFAWSCLMNLLIFSTLHLRSRFADADVAVTYPGRGIGRADGSPAETGNYVVSFVFITFQF